MKANAMSYYEQRRPELLRIIPNAKGKRVLDVGCAGGVFGKLLGDRDKCVVIGIEKELDICRRAKARIGVVVCMDVSQGLPFRYGSVDMIIFADILEHLYDPSECVREWKKALKPGGIAIISLPNVRHFNVTIPLLIQGKFQYKDSGILDRTHIRFFTRQSGRRMLEGSGLRIISETPHRTPWSVRFRLLNLLTLGIFHDFFVQQWIFTAVVK